MSVLQSLRQQSVRDETGTARDYNSDWSALFDDAGIAAGPWNGRLLAWINDYLGTSYTNLPGAMQAFAVDQGFANWSSMGTFDAAGAFLPGAATFDGTNDYMTRGAALTGAADSATGIFSGWIKLSGGNGAAARILRTNGGKINIARLAANTLFVGLTDVGSNNFQIPSATTYTAADVWLHMLASWNTNATAGNKVGHLYINDVNDRGTLVDPNGAFNVEMDGETNWAIGAQTGGTDKLNGDLAEIYFAPGQFLDFSIEANRRKFIDANGLAVDLGEDGSAPTGVAPLVYQSLRPGDAVTAFATNRGTGGNFTITGTLVSAAEGPNDDPFDPAVAVASATGDDGNSGVNVANALETLGAVDWANGLKAGLVGSWREHISESAIDGVDLRSVAIGELAEISGADVITGWTEHATQANVWEKSLDHDGFGSDRFTVYEDGVLLTRVANVATCNSTAGSFVYKKASDGDPATIQIHASDSGDPNSNGKVYEVSARASAVLLGDNARVEGLHVTKALGAGGSIKVGLNGDLRRIVSSDGTKHNVFLGSGSAADVIAVRSDPVTAEEPSKTYFVSYQDDPEGLEVSYTRCFAVSDGSTGGVGFIQHGDTAGHSYDVFAGEQLASVEAGAWEPSAKTATINGYFVKDTSFPFSSFTDDGTFEYFQVLWTVAGAGRQIITQPMTPGGPAVHRYRNCVFYDDGSNDSIFRQGAAFDGCTLELENCVIYHNAFRPTMQHNSWSSGTLKVNRCIFAYPNAGTQAIEVPAGVAYEGNNNVFIAPANGLNLNYHGTGNIDSIAAWQSATGQDANSILVTAADVGQVFTGSVASGNFTVGNTGAGALVSALLAGPQSHWDWNTRAVAVGPPTAWPDAPETLAESATYVEDPEAWNFYP